MDATPELEAIRDHLIALAVDAKTELEALHKSNKIEVAQEYGRYQAAREALIIFLVGAGWVADFQAANVAETIIQNVYSNR